MEGKVMGVLLVTGSGRGIGADIARLASDRGWDIGVNDIAIDDNAESVLEDVRSNGARAIAVRADVSVPDEVETLFQTVEQELGPITGLVNNAGISTGIGKIEELDIDETRRMFEINLFGLFVCCRSAVRRMAKCHGGQGGAIVNISSSSARTAAPGNFVDYAAGKGAIDTLTIGLAKEQGPEGIRVNAVRPGVTNTEMGAELAAKDPDWLERLMRSTPLGRMAEMRDVSAAVLWLLSDEARHVTGAIIDVSGGSATQ